MKKILNMFNSNMFNIIGTFFFVIVMPTLMHFGSKDYKERKEINKWYNQGQPSKLEIMTANVLKDHRVSLVKALNNTKESWIKNKPETYIPFEKELRIIEQEKYNKKTNNCLNKALKYQKILEKNNEISYVATGWISGIGKVKHARIYVFNKKTRTWHLIDPTWKKGRDGLPVKYYQDWYVHYIFNKDAGRFGIRHKRYNKMFVRSPRNILNFEKRYNKFKKNLK